MIHALAEVLVEAAFQRAAAQAGSGGDFGRTDGLLVMFPNEAQRPHDGQVGYRQNVGADAGYHPFGRNQDRRARRTLAVHQPVQQPSPLIADALPVRVHAGEWHQRVVADHRVVVATEHRHLLGHAQVRVIASAQQTAGEIVGAGGDTQRFGEFAQGSDQPLMRLLMAAQGTCRIP